MPPWKRFTIERCLKYDIYAFEILFIWRVVKSKMYC